MIFAREEDHLLEILYKFLTICRKRRLLVSLIKADLYRKEACWFGRIIDADRI